MSAGTITAGEAYVSVTCDNSGLIQGLQESSATISTTAAKIAAAEEKLRPKIGVEGVDALEKALNKVEKAVDRVQKSVSEGVTALATVANGAFRRLGRATFDAATSLGDFGDKFDKMAGRTGVSTSALTEYAHAASMCGADISNVEGALRGMATKLNDAALGKGEALEVFRALGVSVESLLALEPEKQFDALAQALAGVADPTTRAALAMKVFGGDGQKLLPLFASGSKGLKEMREEARNLGVSLSTEAAAGGAAFVDAATRLKTSFQGVSASIATLFQPALTNAANKLATFVSTLSKWAKENPRAATAATVAAGAISGIGAAVVATSVYLPILATGFRNLCATITAISAHPIIAATVALAALTAAVGVYYATRKAGAGSVPKYSDEAADALEAGNRLREEDQNRLQRLEELRDKERLATNEIVEAVEIVAELNSRYGDVGVSVDALTGKINIAADAQKRLNALQLAAKKAEIEAALVEAEANAEEGVIEKEVADKEVGLVETAIGKKRGESWGSYLFNWDWYSDSDDLKVAIAQDDPEFQKKVAAKRKANDARIASLRAQSDALGAAATANANGAFSNQTAPANGAPSVGDSILDEIDDFAAEAESTDLTPIDRKIAELEEKGEKLKDAVWNALAPGFDRSNADAVLAFANSDAGAFEETQALFDKIDAATSANVQKERDAAAAKEKEEAEKAAAKAAEESRRAAEKSAAETESAQARIAAFEKKRADEGKTAIERKIDAIKEETAAYIEQLEKLRSLEEAKGALADVQKIAALNQKIVDAEKDGDDRSKSALADAEKSYFEKFATPFEKFETAQKELTDALKALADAKKDGSETAVAAALEKLGIAREKYDATESAARAASESATSATESAVESIGAKLETSSVGTFSAYQAAANANGYDKRIYENGKRQVQLLESIERKSGVGAAFA